MAFAKRIRNNWTSIIATALVVFGVMAPTVALASASQPRDCDLNSIVYCGAYSKSEWLGKVNSGDTKHSAANIQNIYFNEGRGITRANFESSSTVDGTVFKDGRVVVNGKTVATGAKSIGRDFMPGSVKSGDVWMRPTQTSFAADSIQAWVNMDGGTFHFFVLKSCGNAGVATPTPKPKPTPTPTPKPTPTPTPTPTPVASFECVALTPTQPDVDNRPNTFRFTVTPKTKNVTVTGFRFSFSDHSAQVTTPANQPFIEKDVTTGSLKVMAQVLTNKGETAISDVCSAKVTANQPVPTPTPTPTPTPQVLGTSTLPDTGAESALGGIAGLTGIAYAGRAYIRSRKSLLGTMRGKRDL